MLSATGGERETTQYLIVKSVRQDLLHPELARRFDVIQEPTVVNGLGKHELRALVDATYENVSSDALIHGVKAEYRIPQTGTHVSLWDFDYDEPVRGEPTPSMSAAEKFKIAVGDLASRTKNATARTAKSIGTGALHLAALPFAAVGDPILVIDSDDRLDLEIVAKSLTSTLQRIMQSAGYGTAMHRRIATDLANMETALQREQMDEALAIRARRHQPLLN